MKPIVESNKGIHWEYISTILHMALNHLDDHIIREYNWWRKYLSCQLYDKRRLDDLFEEIICKQIQATMEICDLIFTLVSLFTLANELKDQIVQ